MWPRRLLAADPTARRWVVTSVACGAAAAVALVAWTLLLARVIDLVFVRGRSLGDVTPELAAMVVLLAARAGCIWMAEVAGQRASGHLRATVRATLAQHLVAVGPAGLDQERVGEVAATVGTGVDSLDAYLTAFLPAAALAVVVPALVFVTIGVLDPWSTLILVFTGPMLVLLLAVIGGRTRALTQRRFQELGWLSSFSLDMIRGLATLKAFRRAADGADTIGEVSRRYGDSTMDVLRTAFQTSLVMEWAATAATALVAVQVSFRLVSDRLSFGTALAVLVLTPEFFAPLRRLALEYHAGQAGRAAVDRIEEIRALPVLAATSSAGRAGTRSGVPARHRRRDRVPRRLLHLPGIGPARPGGDRPAGGGRRDGGVGRAQRRGQDHRGPPGDAVHGPHRGLHHAWTASRSVTSTRPGGGAHVAWVPQHPAVFAGHGGRQHPPGPTRRLHGPGACRRPRRRGRRVHRHVAGRVRHAAR